MKSKTRYGPPLQRCTCENISLFSGVNIKIMYRMIPKKPNNMIRFKPDDQAKEWLDRLESKVSVVLTEGQPLESSVSNLFFLETFYLRPLDIFLKWMMVS